MRILAYLANTAFVIALLVSALNEPSLNGVQILIFALLFTLPLINFLALSGKEKDFFSLYFERKRLEQEKKIAELKKSIDEKT